MLQVNDLTYRIGDRLLFDHTSVPIPPNAKVGFVGRNGAGKTTLFSIVCDELAAESGSTSIPRGLKIGRVAQEAPGGPETLLDVVLAADVERAALMAERDTATAPERIAEIEMRLTDIGAHSAEARAGAILHGLGFDKAAQGRACSTFSGGWRMRVALAAILFAEPDLLLLDEPTNYLDLEGTLWLYDYLGRYPRTAIVISHDRELLDTAVDHILHLDQGKLTLYRGGYTSFDRQRREKLAHLVKHKEKQDAERAHVMAFVDRFRAKASKARQAQSRLKRLEKMDTISITIESDVKPFYLPGAPRPLAPPLISMEGAGVGYDGVAVLDRLNLTLAPDDRIALLGPNGNGKSTFAKLMTVRLPVLKGVVKRPESLRAAFFAQHQLDELDTEGTPFSHISQLMPNEPESRRRAAAARMGFGADKSNTLVTNLSGGEKARLQFGIATFGGAHLLVLDEPTNHLDIDSRAALATALNEFPGAVILISHDRYLIESTCDRLWLVAGGTVKPYDGDLDDYRKLVLAGPEAERRRADPTDARAIAKREAAERRVALAPLRKKIADIETRMQKFNDLIAKIDSVLADGSAYRRDPARANELNRQRTELGGAVARAEEEWLQATGQLEASRAAE